MAFMTETAELTDGAIEAAVRKYLLAFYKSKKNSPANDETYVLLANDIELTNPDAPELLHVTAVGNDATRMERSGYKHIATVTGGYDDGADRWNLKVKREK